MILQDRTFLRTANIGFIGNGLTPTPAETLAAEQEGLIVAYLPGGGAPTRQVFAVRDGERVQVS